MSAFQRLEDRCRLRAVGALALARRDLGSLLVAPARGQGEILRTGERLARRAPGPGVEIAHAVMALSIPRDQDRAIAPAPPRPTARSSLRTSIAEISLTIQGVRVVIDTVPGRACRASIRPAASTRLATVRVSRAAADQRRGRRRPDRAAGVCFTAAMGRGRDPRAPGRLRRPRDPRRRPLGPRPRPRPLGRQGRDGSWRLPRSAARRRPRRKPAPCWSGLEALERRRPAHRPRPSPGGHSARRRAWPTWC